MCRNVEGGCLMRGCLFFLDGFAGGDLKYSTVLDNDRFEGLIATICLSGLNLLNNILRIRGLGHLF